MNRLPVKLLCYFTAHEFKTHDIRIMLTGKPIDI